MLPLQSVTYLLDESCDLIIVDVLTSVSGNSRSNLLVG